MPTFDVGEFHAGKRATLLLMLALFAFGAVSGWSGREMFDASRAPQMAQAVAQPKEDEPPAKSQQPQKETVSKEVPALPEQFKTEPVKEPRAYPYTGNSGGVPLGQGPMLKQAPIPDVSEAFEEFKDQWRHFWLLDYSDDSTPLRTHGGIIE